MMEFDPVERKAPRLVSRAPGRGRQRAWAWYSRFGRISTADAIRFDMLKNEAHGRDVPDVAVREAGPAQRLPVLLLDREGALGQLRREIEHRAVPRFEIGGAKIHHHHLAEHRVARELAHRGAVGGEAVVAAVEARHDHSDHLALELRQPRGREHQVVVHPAKASSLAPSCA
jgi:hypothetical protein